MYNVWVAVGEPGTRPLAADSDTPRTTAAAAAPTLDPHTATRGSACTTCAATHAAATRAATTYAAATCTAATHTATNGMLNIF